MAFVRKTWLDVPDESNPPPGAVATEAAEFNRLEAGIEEAHAHLAEKLIAHGGTLIYVEASTVPPSNPPTGLEWLQTDGIKRLLQNEGTPAVPVWEDVTRDKLIAADLVTNNYVVGPDDFLPPVPAPESRTVTVPGGAAWVMPRRVAKATQSLTFAKALDTYVYLNRSGDYVTARAANNAAEPAQPADTIRLFMARTDADVAQVDTVDIVTVVASTIYTVRINGVDVTYTSDADPTEGEIALGLVAAINNSTDPNVTVVTAATAAVATDAAATFTITADVAGDPFTLTTDANLSATTTTANNASHITAVTDLRNTEPTVRGAGSGSGGGYVSQTHIEGLNVRWDSGSALTVESGSAYIPALGVVLDVPNAISKTALTFTASTWYYLYLFDNAGTPDIEISTTAPAAPYRGTARIKGGAAPDNTRRYIGAVRSNADATPRMLNFLRSGTVTRYREKQDSPPFRILLGGTSTTETAVSCATVVPSTARLASMRLINASNVDMFTGTSDDSAAGPPSSGIAGLGGNTNFLLDHPLNIVQEFTYWLRSAPSSGGAYADVYGYVEQR